MTTPEGPNTPEIQFDPLGRELTEKIVKLMRNPKSDFMPGLIDELVKEDGVAIDDELLVNDRSLLTAYYNPSSGAHVYLQMPEPGSPSSTASDSRWHIAIDMPGDGVRGKVIVEKTDLSIDELDYQVTFTKDIRVSVKGELERATYKQPKIDPDDFGGNLTAFLEHFDEEERLREQIYGGSYDDESHSQIIEILDSLRPNHILLKYNPADGEY